MMADSALIRTHLNIVITHERSDRAEETGRIGWLD